MAKLKKVKSITPAKPESKKQSPDFKYLGDYTHLVSRERVHISERRINELCNLLPAWAKSLKGTVDKHCAYKITNFLEDQDIPESTWYEWLDKYPQLQEAHNDALSLLGNRREAGALHRWLLENTVHKTLGAYDPRVWGKSEERLAKLKHVTVTDSSGKEYILIEKEPESELVTEKLKIKNAS